MRAALLGLLLLAACNPYDPNLGDRPFQCGTEPPRCPDGYVAVDITAIRCECTRKALAMDAGPYECTDDVQEPNNTREDAWETDIGENNRMKNYPLSSVCPATDEDYFKFTAPRNPTPVKVTTMFDTNRKPPSVDILTVGGVSVAPDQGVGGIGVLVTTKTALPMGSYVVRIHGEQEVNYNVTIEILIP